MFKILGRKRQEVSQEAEAPKCTCSRCNCAHALDEHEKRTNALGYEQVFCRACNDICLTHTL